MMLNMKNHDEIELSFDDTIYKEDSLKEDRELSHSTSDLSAECLENFLNNTNDIKPHRIDIKLKKYKSYSD